MANPMDSRSPTTSLLTAETRLERSPSPQPLAPNQYADAVSKHSQQTIESSLYPGENFDKLASYLRKAVQPGAPPSTGASAFPQKASVDFVSSYIFFRSGKHGSSTKHISSPQGLQERHDEFTRQAAASSQVLFLRGQPSSDWLVTVGATYRVDPEFFQRHLDFYVNSGRRDFFSLPALSPSGIIELHYTTIGEWTRPYPEQEPTQDDIEHLRKACAESKRQYDILQLEGNIHADTGLGKSIVREFWAFDERHFAIEQRMTITVEKVGREWVALVWTDTGQDLHEEGQFMPGPWSSAEKEYGPGPWMGVKGPGGSWKPRALYPTIQVQSHTALKYHRTNIPKSLRPKGRFIQSASLLPINYGRSLDEKTAARDPFYAVSELSTFCAFSESQFLNMLQTKLDSMVSEEALSKRALELSNLLYMQKAVKRHIERLRNNIQAIEVHGSATWPRSDDGKGLDKVEAVARVLRRQYDDLLRRAESLSTQVEDQTRFLTNKAMIDEATRARHQAIEVTKLTRLAFFYIPLSFVASFFGMNLDPLTDARNSLMWFFVVSVPVLFVSVAFMQWNVLYVLRNAWSAVRPRQKSSS